MKLFRAMLSATLLAASASVAAAPSGGMFGQMDTNGDGRISLQEWQAASQARFQKLDTNHDGYIEQDELQAVRDRLRQRFRERWQQQQGQQQQ